MTAPPLVSVIVPYRDAISTLSESLASVLADGYPSLEVLAVDDGSRDGGPRLVRELAERDARVVPLESEGTGIVAALSVGLARARGEYVARMDADDITEPGRFAKQVMLLGSDSRLAAVGTQVRAFPAEAVTAGLAHYLEWQNARVEPGDIARSMFVESPLCHPSVMMRRAALVRVGGYRDVPWAEDYDLWLRLDATGFRLGKVPEVLVRWRRHAAQATFTDPRYALERYRHARAHFLAPRLRARGLPLRIWGAGPTGKRFARALEHENLTAAGFVDIDPRKVGRLARGVRIDPPESLERGASVILVAVGTKGARDEIRQHLVSRGFVETKDFYCVA